jgi:hypothetical protein
MLLKPKIKLEKITDISLEILKKYNINSLILDVDNTLSTHHGHILTDGLEEWLDLMHNNGIKQVELAEKVGITNAYAGMILRGERKPPNIRERMETALNELIKAKG